MKWIHIVVLGFIAGVIAAVSAVMLEVSRYIDDLQSYDDEDEDEQ